MFLIHSPVVALSTLLPVPLRSLSIALWLCGPPVAYARACYLATYKPSPRESHATHSRRALQKVDRVFSCECYVSPVRGYTLWCRVGVCLMPVLLIGKTGAPGVSLIPALLSSILSNCVASSQ
jgi:hypothetical protein